MNLKLKISGNSDGVFKNESKDTVYIQVMWHIRIPMSQKHLKILSSHFQGMPKQIFGQIKRHYMHSGCQIDVYVNQEELRVISLIFCVNTKKYMLYL